MGNVKTGMVLVRIGDADVTDMEYDEIFKLIMEGMKPLPGPLHKSELSLTDTPQPQPLFSSLPYALAPPSPTQSVPLAPRACIVLPRWHKSSSMWAHVRSEFKLLRPPFAAGLRAPCRFHCMTHACCRGSIALSLPTPSKLSATQDGAM